MIVSKIVALKGTQFCFDAYAFWLHFSWALLDFESFCRGLIKISVWVEKKKERIRDRWNLWWGGGGFISNKEGISLAAVPENHNMWMLKTDVMTWLILWVNLTGLRGAQIAGKALFLDVSVRVSSEEISIWIRSISKDHCHQYGWVSSKLWRSWIEQKGRERRNLLSLPELLCLPPPALRHKHSWFPGLWTQKWT